MQKLILDWMSRAEDTACCRPWRPCCCSRSCAHRPPACACASPPTASLSFATTTWQSGYGAMATCPFIPRQATGRPSCSPRSTSPPTPPIRAGRKGLMLPQTTVSWHGRSSGGRYSTTAAKGSGGAGWPCPWMSPPTSWTSCLTWPRQKTCAQRRLKTRASWRTLVGESDHVRHSYLTAMTGVGLLVHHFLSSEYLMRLLFLSAGNFFSNHTARQNISPPVEMNANFIYKR